MIEVLALVVYGVWILVAFGIRTVVQFRRTGDAGWRGVSGKFASAEWLAGVSFSAALAVGLLGPVAALAGMDPFAGAAAFRWIGLAIAVVGVACTVAAQRSMSDSWRIGVDIAEVTELRTSGAFDVVRNPIFSAMVVTAVGLALMVPNAVSLLGVVALVIAVELQVRVVEEPYLRTVHGSRYVEYEGRVGRFLPRFRIARQQGEAS